MIPNQEAIIVCIDDDSSFLELYKEKLKEKKIRVFNPNELKDFDFFGNYFFLIDYDLSTSFTGIDIIEEYGLSGESILVTSMYQDKSIQEKCDKLNVKLLPKQILNQAQVNMKDDTLKDSDYVLIDDDDLVHSVWKLSAKKNNKNLSTFHTIKDFIDQSEKYNCDTIIYVDSNLKDNIKGEIASKEISALGFKNIILATGHEESIIEKPEWIIKIQGKDPPF